MKMDQHFASTTVTITELGEDPEAVVEAANAAPVAILRDTRAAAYVVAAEVFEALVEALEDAELAEIVKNRRGGPTRKVTLDDL
jgi:antitoxin StbD